MFIYNISTTTEGNRDMIHLLKIPREDEEKQGIYNVNARFTTLCEIKVPHLFSNEYAEGGYFYDSNLMIRYPISCTKCLDMYNFLILQNLNI